MNLIVGRVNSDDVLYFTVFIPAFRCSFSLLMPVAYCPLTILLMFNRSFKDLMTSCYCFTVLIVSPYRPFAKCFNIAPVQKP